MAISDVPILSMLRTRMQWHQERQRVLAENVANSDTPKFRPRDLKELKFDQNAGTGRRHARQHQSGAFRRRRRQRRSSRPTVQLRR